MESLVILQKKEVAFTPLLPELVNSSAAIHTPIIFVIPDLSSRLKLYLDQIVFEKLYFHLAYTEF